MTMWNFVCRGERLRQMEKVKTGRQMEKVKKGVEMFSKLPSVAIAAIALAAATAKASVEVGNPGFPYSAPGSFLTVGRHENGKYMFRSASGLWIRNVSTAWREDVCRLVPSDGVTSDHNPVVVSVGLER